MALVLKDRVKDTTTTTGTGTITLANSAPTGYQAFSAVGDGNQTWYCIQGGSEWEVGVGTYTSSGTTLSRTYVYGSSNSGSLVNFSAGTKTVISCLPAGAGADINNYSAIINGDMNIAQRGTNFPAIASASYTLDRYNTGNTSAAVYTVSQNTDVPTVAQAGRLFTKSLNLQVTTADASLAAGDLVAIYQPIEGFNWLPLAQRVNTFSAWCKAKKTGVYGATQVNSGTDRSVVAEFTINAADTWEYKTVSFPASPTAGTWNYTNGVGIYMGICLMAGSTFQTTANAWQTGSFRSTANQVNAMDNTANYFRTTGWKLEPGSVATMSQPKIFSDELAACQRYYQLITITMSTVFFSYYGGSAAKSQHYKFSPDMRITPSLSITNPGVEYYSYAGVWTASTLSSWSVTPTGVEVSCASDGDGRGKLMRPGAGGVNPSPILVLSAEL